jgi:hypothetical protein
MNLCVQIILPGWFWLWFIISGTIVLVWTLRLHQPLPKGFVIIVTLVFVLTIFFFLLFKLRIHFINEPTDEENQNGLGSDMSPKDRIKSFLRLKPKRDEGSGRPREGVDDRAPAQNDSTTAPFYTEPLPQIPPNAHLKHHRPRHQRSQGSPRESLPPRGKLRAVNPDPRSGSGSDESSRVMSGGLPSVKNASSQGHCFETPSLL